MTHSDLLGSRAAILLRVRARTPWLAFFSSSPLSSSCSSQPQLLLAVWDSCHRRITYAGTSCAPYLPRSACHMMPAWHERVPCAVPCFSVARALSKRVALDAFVAAASYQMVQAVAQSSVQRRKKALLILLVWRSSSKCCAMPSSSMLQSMGSCFLCSTGMHTKPFSVVGSIE